jgi:hypothetical protein
VNRRKKNKTRDGFLNKKKRRYLSLLTIASLLFSVISGSLSPLESHAEATQTMTVVFDESPNQTMSKTVTIPNLAKVESVNVDNGTVSYSQNGKDVTLQVSNGNVYRSQWNSYKYSKYVTDYATSSYQYGFSSTKYYSDYEGYSGYLSQSGSPYVISGSYIPSDSKTVTDYRISSSTSDFPYSIYYNQGGYSGTLYQSGSPYVNSINTFPNYTTGKVIGTTDPWEEPSYSPTTYGYWTRTNVISGKAKRVYVYAPSWGRYSVGYYVPYTGAECYTWLSHGGSYSPEGCNYDWWDYYYNHGGNKIFKWDSYSSLRDAYITYWSWTAQFYQYRQDYSGVVTKPPVDTRVWRQDYAGYVYKGGYDYYYRYVVTIKYSTDENPPTLNLSYDDSQLSNKVIVTATAFDNETNIKSIILPNGQVVYSSTATYTITQNGQYTFKAEDNAGNQTSKTIQISNIENQSPNSPSINVNENWTTENQTVEIQDNGDNGIAGVDRIEYSLSGSTNKDWSTYEAPFVIQNEGQTTISARVIDKVGNISSVATKVVRIDRTAPDIYYSINPSSWTKGDATIQVFATDGLSGVKRIQLPNGNWVSGSSVSFTVPTNGTVEFTAEDNAGNIATKQVTVSNIDKNSPSLSLTTNISSWTNQDVVITATANDGESGIDKIQLPNSSFVQGATASYTVTNNGTFTFTAFDKVGNPTTKTISVNNIDKTAPSITITPNTTNWTQPSSPVLLQVQTSDVGSGVKRIKLPNGEYVNGDSAVYSVTENGTYTFVVEDNVGLQTTKSITVSNIDGLSPQASHSILPSGWTNGTVSITVNATDDRSGVKEIKKPDGTTVQGSNVSFTVSQNGKYDFEIIDNAGNKKVYSVTVTNIDKEAPSVTFSLNPTGWTNGNVTININATDAQSGVKRIQLPNGSWVFGTTASYNVSKNGQYDFVVEDNVGNRQTQIVQISTIDKEAPMLSLSTDIAYYTNQDVTITATVTDTQSQVKRIQLPNGNWVDGDTASYKVSTNGTYTFKAEDYAGNITTQSITVGNIAPDYVSELVYENIPTVMEAGEAYTVTVKVKNKGKKVWSEANQIRLGAVGDSDPFAPVRQTLGSNEVGFGEIATFTFEMIAPKQPGTYTTDWAMVEDRPGVTPDYWFPTLVSKSVTVRDTTSPSLDITASTDDWVQNSIVLTATATDKGSGVKRIQRPDGVWVSGSVATFTITNNGTYQFKAEDFVGNITTQSITISNIDKVAPSLTITPNTTSWTNQDVVLTVEGTDVGSGVKRIRLPNGDWVNNSVVTYIVSQNGTYTFTVEDNVGNQTTKSITINNIDKTPPTAPSISNYTDWTKNTPVQVTITAGSDAQSGVEKAEYKLEGATTKDWTTYTGAISITNEGITKVTARTVDKLGNPSPETTSYVKIDKSAPHNTGITIKLKP